MQFPSFSKILSHTHLLPTHCQSMIHIPRSALEARRVLANLQLFSVPIFEHP